MKVLCTGLMWVSFLGFCYGLVRFEQGAREAGTAWMLAAGIVAMATTKWSARV